MQVWKGNRKFQWPKGGEVHGQSGRVEQSSGARSVWKPKIGIYLVIR